MAVALRTALIWRDEVMDDVVLDKPTSITVGHTGKPTFVVPDIGLPKLFAIVRPGNRGYLLTLGEHMRGKMCIDGRERDVAEFVARGDGDLVGGFRATPIGGKDWGVVDLDESGDYKLFFQFVPIEEAHVPFYATPKFKLFALAHMVVTSNVLAAIFWKIGGVTTDYSLLGSDSLMLYAELVFRGAALAAAALILAALVLWITHQDGESQASFGFSVVLHAALLFMTYQLYDASDPFSWPGPRDITANYLATRLEPEPKPEPPKTVGEKQQTAAAAAKKEQKVAVTKGSEAAMGGKGEKERKRDPNAIDAPPSPPKVAFFEDKNKKMLDSLDQNLQTSLNKFDAIPGERKPGDMGFGTGTGTGVGEGHGTGTTRGGHGSGTGGGGHAEGDFISTHGQVDTGGNRPGGGNCAKPPCGTGMKEVKVALSDPEGDFGGLTAEEINRVVKARAGVFRACYQKELNRSPGLGGKLVMHFVISGSDGSVKSAKTGAGSTMHNDEVESCVSSNIMRLKFPAKGGLANVNYPFLFQPGG
ncbi:MAG TPA: AgmX/PglI C-terminal domain-containing protein [Kofleriaceae bacterium]|jgi:hypothetical protein|nr:AgmX/PglI C-terminal domain-containing protein [Kofleriaceae bacterium]